MASIEESDPNPSHDEVRIIVEDQTITCKKQLLMENSDYFRAMFESNMVECRTGEVTLKCQSYEIVNNLVTFIRTGEIDLQPSNAMEVGEAAIMLQIKSAIDECEDFMIKGLDSKCCVRFMHFAKDFNLSNAYNHARRYSLQHFSEAVQDGDFFQQDLSQLLHYLSDKHLNCASELGVLDTCNGWIHEDEAARRGQLEQLLTCVHPEDFTDKEWVEVIAHPLLQDDPGRGVLETWLQNRKHKTQKFREVPVVIMTFGGILSGEDHDRPCTDICSYDEEHKEFIPAMSLKDLYNEVGLKMGYRVTVVGTDLYLSGGQACLTRSKFEGLWRYDGCRKRWRQLDDPPTSRRHHGACSSETHLFMLGGFGRYRQILDSVDQYDTISGKWSNLPKVPFPCFSPEVVHHSNKLYLYKSAMYCLDLHTRAWTTLCSFNNHTLTSVQLVVVNEYIYEFPYVDNEVNWLCACEKSLFGRYNTTTQTYEVIHSQGVPERQFGNRVIVHNNTVYTINMDKDFVCCNLDNMKEITNLGCAKQTGTGAELIALPLYSRCRKTDHVAQHS